MFTSALKSFSSNITSNYTVAPSPTCTAGPWRIFDAKKKGSDKRASVFVFDRKSLEPQGGAFGVRQSASSLKRAHDEVLERLKKEASSLARLRHPSILELAEPVEETSKGGLMFATELVTGTLTTVLLDKTAQETSGNRHVIQETEAGTRRRREVEIDELEIQKGLLQIAKGLEFLHESAGLVHANLTPDAIFVNAKQDWKIGNFKFLTPVDHSSSTSSTVPISLSEVLNHDARLPPSVQMNTDFTSPDFVMDNNISSSADIFSLGLVIIALYNSPHRSPLETGHSISTYKRMFSSPSTIPTLNNNFLCTGTLPREIKSDLLPKMITRRPAQRLSAREFQQASYFDNVLVSTLRFLESLPAKSPNEKSQFLRGLPRILPQFPKSVLEKKVLPALLDETKDFDLLALILQNTFKALESVPNAQRAFSERVLPSLRNVFLSTSKSKTPGQERDSLKEAGLVVLLENMSVITSLCSGKEFKDDILPIIYIALDSPTHSLVDQALDVLNVVLPSLDFSTIKNELFPAVATVFSKTSSLAIKIRGLEALNVLCGGSTELQVDSGDGLGTFDVKPKEQPSSSAVLDKYTVQEKIVPLLKGIKTKEPAVMMAALAVFKQVGKVADSDFLALDILPCLWAFSLGPLLNLEQFQNYMTLIKSLSSRVEHEHARKLGELSNGGGKINRATISNTTGLQNGGGSINDDGDFESLVTGRKLTADANLFDAGWGNQTATRPSVPRVQSQQTPTFSWSTTQTLATPINQNSMRSVTPDQTIPSFATLTPSTQPAHSLKNNFALPLQPQQAGNTTMTNEKAIGQMHTGMGKSIPASFNNGWGAPMVAKPSILSSPTGTQSTSFGQQSKFAQQSSPAQAPYSNFSIAPPPNKPVMLLNKPPSNSSSTMMPAAKQTPKQGLDNYASLI